MSSYIHNILSYFNYYTTKYKIIMLGLDAAGKTTILYQMSSLNVETTIPTIGFNVEILKLNSNQFICWDIGGCDKIRPLWKHYTENSTAFVLVVDSNDKERFPDVKNELSLFIEDETMKNIPLLVFANKQDLVNSETIENIIPSIGLDHVVDRPWNIQSSCAVSRHGIKEGFQWLESILNKKPEIISSDSISYSTYFSRSYTNKSILTSNHAIAHIRDFKLSNFISNEVSNPENELWKIEKQIKLNEQQKMIAILDDWYNRIDNPDDEFIDQLKNYTLESWDHYTHIRLGWMILKSNSLSESFDIISNLIQNFIMNSPRTNGKSFHQTMTRFWCHMIAFALTFDSNSKTDFKLFISKCVPAVDLWNSTVFKKYYTNERMFSSEARTSIIQPDILSLPLWNNRFVEVSDIDYSFLSSNLYWKCKE